MEFSRVGFLISRVRLRIRNLAKIQDQVKEDVKLFCRGGEEAKAKFEETRQRYLDLLKISLEELRDAISMCELSATPDGIFVEQIMGRVRPMTDKYLDRLVQTGIISTCDKECIISGGYPSVEAFFEDLDNNVGSFGAEPDAGSPSDGAHAGPGTVVYDENGFLEDNHRGENSEPQKKMLTSIAEDLPSSSSSIEPPVSLRPSELFIWSDDEDDLEMSEPLPEQHGEPSTSYLPPQEEAESNILPIIPPNSENGPSITYGADGDENDEKAFKGYRLYGLDQDDEEESETQDAVMSDQGEEPESPATLVRPEPIVHTSNNEADMLMEWLEEHDMWYWQYEVVYAALLAATKLKGDFQAARDAYKVDPFADWD